MDGEVDCAWDWDLGGWEGEGRERMSRTSEAVGILASVTCRAENL